MLVNIQTVGTITNLNWADGRMESRKAPPDCSYLIILLHVYGTAFLPQMYDICLAYNYASHADEDGITL